MEGCSVQCEPNGYTGKVNKFCSRACMSTAKVTEVLSAVSTIEQENDAEYFRKDFWGMRQLCARSMSAEEIKAVGAKDNDQAQLAYVIRVQELVQSSLERLPIVAGLTEPACRKLMYCCMYKTFGVLSSTMFAPDKTGQEAFAMEQIDIAAGSNLLHDFVVYFITKKRSGGSAASIISWSEVICDKVAATLESGQIRSCGNADQIRSGGNADQTMHQPATIIDKGDRVEQPNHRKSCTAAALGVCQDALVAAT